MVAASYWKLLEHLEAWEPAWYVQQIFVALNFNTLLVFFCHEWDVWTLSHTVCAIRVQTCGTSPASILKPKYCKIWSQDSTDVQGTFHWEISMLFSFWMWCFIILGLLFDQTLVTLDLWLCEVAQSFTEMFHTCCCRLNSWRPVTPSRLSVTSDVRSSDKCYITRHFWRYLLYT